MKTHCSQRLAAALGCVLTVRVPAPEQVSWFDGRLADHHYLGAGRPVGDYLPGYGVFNPVLTRMDAEALATLLTGWLQARAGPWPAALALGGKMIRDHIGLLTLAQHEDRAPQAVAVYDPKEATPRCEQTAAAALLEKLPALDDQLVTADPLHCQRAHARTTVEKGGDYWFQMKGNQPKLLQQAQKLDALAGTPLFVRSESGHGRGAT